MACGMVTSHICAHAIRLIFLMLCCDANADVGAGVDVDQGDTRRGHLQLPIGPAY